MRRHGSSRRPWFQERACPRLRGGGRSVRSRYLAGDGRCARTCRACPRRPTPPAALSFVPIVSEAIPATTVQRAASAAPGIEVKLAGAVVRVSSGMDDAAQFDRGVARGSRLGHLGQDQRSAGARILLATRPIDFRKGAHGLAALAQEVLAEDPFSGAVIVWRSKRADRVKTAVDLGHRPVSRASVIPPGPVSELGTDRPSKAHSRQGR